MPEPESTLGGADTVGLKGRVAHSFALFANEWGIDALR
jgi:hypothetical protein